MFLLKIEFTDQDGQTIKNTLLTLSGDQSDSGNIANQVVSYAEDIINNDEVEDESTEEGRVITPLPPDRIRTDKIEGIVTPKPPFQVAREQEARLRQVPNA